MVTSVSDSPDNLEAYTDLGKQADDAWAAFVDAADSLFTRLRTTDPGLAKLAMDLFGSERAAALAFVRRNVYEGRPSWYDELASGQREEVHDRIVRVSHGIF